MPINCGNALSTTPHPTMDPQLSRSTALKSPSANAVVVGLYGIPGSGKTFLLERLKQELGHAYFAFYEGSQVIAAAVPGGLEAFQKLEEPEKVQWRQLAIDTIGRECAESGKVAVVAGHFMFWAEGEESGRLVYTQNDLDTFSHILYLDVPADDVAEQRHLDTKRSRPSLSVAHLQKWQQAEKTQLRDLCRRHGILFSLLSPRLALLNKALALLRDFQRHTEGHNQSIADSRLDEVLAASRGQLETVLVMDADRTLTAEDTGSLFWKRASSCLGKREEDCPLKTLFSSALGYSYTAFRQATLLYEEADDQRFDALCQEVASTVTMYPEFVSLLQQVASREHIGAVIVTCGLRRVWDKVLEREGLAEIVKVIGGGRIADGFVVTAEVKAALVTRLRDTHQTYVWAFGDSPLDLEMLSKADQAIVVVGEERSRSKKMDAALMDAIDNGGLQVRQAVLPSNALPRLDTARLPLAHLTDQEFLDSVLCRRRKHASIQVFHATDKRAAKLLMTPMRDADVKGKALRKAHRRVGWYLATELVADVIGIEGYSISHVQGHRTDGYRLFNEQETLIVALMRGGEPMAFGVNDAFPLASFLHAKFPNDIMAHHLQNRSTVLLVDSVINSGKTVVEFVEHVRNLHSTIRVVVVAGVVQAHFISGGILAQLSNDPKPSLVALRISGNKFTGKGTTDTGNRLFNTTHLS